MAIKITTPFTKDDALKLKAGDIVEITGLSEKSILSFNDKEVVLCLKSIKLKIKGENLSVDKFCDGDVAVCGKIWAIEKA